MPMKPAENYWQYELVATTPLSADERASTEETIATDQEKGWQKKLQFTRALRDARNGHATMTELIYLARRRKYYPSTPKQFIVKPKKA